MTKTHGLSGLPEYRAWKLMRRRCSGRSRHHVKYYAARGIKVCARWKAWNTGFECFLADMGRKPTPKHTLDRIDNDGDYEPNNCRWATKIEQVNNTSITRKIEFDDRIMALSELARARGLKPGTLRARINRGWPIEDAIRKPIRLDARHA